METWQQEMEEKFEELISSLNELKMEFKETRTALVGNELNKGMSIIDRLSKAENTVESLKLESNKNKLMMSVAMFLGTVIGFIIEMIVQWFSNKK